MAATVLVADFTNVKDDTEGGFRPRQVPDGDYRAKIVKVDDHTSKAGNKGWVFTIVLEAYARSLYPYYVTMDEKSLWKARNLFIAAGMAVPKKKVRVDPNKLVGKTIGVAMISEEYNDKWKSSVDATFPASDVQGNAKGNSSGDTGSADEVDEPTDDDDVDIEEI